MTRQASTGVGLALGLLLTVAHSDALAQAPPTFSLHDAPRPLPEIRFESGDGKAMSLADFRGSVVLLNLWATWCAPCRREMPTLDRLQAALGGPDFQVAALSIDRKGLPVVREFYAELGLERLSIYVDETGAAQRALSVLGLPTTLLVDREGNEVGRLLGPAEWDDPEMVAFLRDYVQHTAAGPGLNRWRPVRADRGGASHTVAGLSFQ
jgi:thiol-disulfide isomerase/thioredoxin